MAKVVICPSCQAKGAIPDDAQVARIRCPKCGTVHRIGGEATAGPAAPPPVTAASLSSSAHRRVPPAAGSPPPWSGAAPSNPATHRVVLFALLGVSGLVVVLLGVIVALLVNKGSGPAGGCRAAIGCDRPDRVRSRGSTGRGGGRPGRAAGRAVAAAFPGARRRRPDVGDQSRGERVRVGPPGRGRRGQPGPGGVDSRPGRAARPAGDPPPPQGCHRPDQHQGRQQDDRQRERLRHRGQRRHRAHGHQPTRGGDRPLRAAPGRRVQGGQSRHWRRSSAAGRDGTSRPCRRRSSPPTCPAT